MSNSKKLDVFATLEAYYRCNELSILIRQKKIYSEYVFHIMMLVCMILLAAYQIYANRLPQLSLTLFLTILLYIFNATRRDEYEYLGRKLEKIRDEMDLLGIDYD